MISKEKTLIWSNRSEDSLSIKEVRNVRRLVTEREREERGKNIMVKGMDSAESIEECKEKIQAMLKDKIGVEGNVISLRKSKKVLIAKIGSEKEKKAIMANKNKLKGGEIFIKNDLSWEDRKIQEDISK